MILTKISEGRFDIFLIQSNHLVHLTSSRSVVSGAMIKETPSTEIASVLEFFVTETSKPGATEIPVTSFLCFPAAMTNVAFFATPATSSSASTAFAVVVSFEASPTAMTTILPCESKKF